MDLKHIKPKTLVFVTTHKCSAQCKNCCFSCSPQKTQRLTIGEMVNYINQVKNDFLDSVKLLVLTGGESFLLGNELNMVIEYAHSQGFRTRIVTNGFWANSEEIAIKRLSQLKKNGLDEINFSTGDEHLQWIPLENIYNGIKASMDQGIVTAVNIETHDSSSFNSTTFINQGALFKYFDKTKYHTPLHVVSGLWVPFARHEQITYEKRRNLHPIFGCDSILSTLAISPYSQLMSCCGLPSEYLTIFRLGNLKEHTIKELYESQYRDLFKLWLYTEGPHNIMEYIYEKMGITEPIIGHTCQICANILKNKENIDCLRQNYDDIRNRVLFKYSLLNNDNN